MCGTHRTEGPAGAALALVLDLGDGALLAPVHLVGHGDVRGRDERGPALVAPLHALQALRVPGENHKLLTKRTLLQFYTPKICVRVPIE